VAVSAAGMSSSASIWKRFASGEGFSNGVAALVLK
jgi:hypothetical protein